jgi:polysaccharide chain length determinant protein (PEP-CTERM system associated)
MSGIGRTLEELTLVLLYAAWRRRYMILLPILIMPFIGFGAAKLAPKDYTAKMTLLVQEPAAINPFLEDLAISTDLKDRMDALKEQMKTRSVLTEIARDAGWIDDATPAAEIDPTLDSLRGSTRIGLVGRELVEISFTAAYAEGLARVVSAVAQRFVDQLLAPARSSVDASERFLGEERARFEAELAEAEARLAEFKAENAEALPALHAQNVQALAQTRAQLAELRADLAGHEARFEIGAQRLSETNPIMGRIDARLAELETALAELLVRYTDHHSAVRRVRAERDALVARRAEVEHAVAAAGAADPDRLWNMLSGDSGETRTLMQDQLALLEDARGRVQRITRQIASLEAREAELAERVRGYAAVEREIVALDREVSVKRELLDRLTERYEMAKVTSALGREAAPDLVRIIDQPQDPTNSNAWPLPIYLIAALIGGVALGGGLAFAAELLDTTITRPAMVADLVGLPLISRLPPISAELRRFDVESEPAFAGAPA